MRLRDLLTFAAGRPSAAREVAPAVPPRAPTVPSATGPRDDVVTAAATNVDDYSPSSRYSPTDQGWQAELWDFYETLGEFAFVVNWKSSTASRVRLRAGKIEPGADEPTLVSDGMAAELVADLVGAGSHSTLLADLITQLSVPAEGWLVGETRDGVEYWCVKSNEELRRRGGRTNRGSTEYEVLDENAPPGTTEWRDLATDSIVVRVWRPHPRRHNEAYSPAKSARGTMRELELINRKIVAQYLSRLASAGFLILPDEVEFPVRPEFVDAANPMFRELVAVASEAIKTPGSAAAAVPIPLIVPAEYADKIIHLDPSMKLDEKEIEKRDSVLRRLATQLDVPGEILTGMGGVNHWGAWAIDEQAFKTHVAPDVELVCAALTVGYLRPRLAASGEDPAAWAVWYDASEVVQRPDKSEHAKDAYDRLEISPEAYRRESGFDEADAPTPTEVQEMILRKLAVEPTLGLEVVKFVDDVAGYLAGDYDEAPPPPAVPPDGTGAPPSPPGEVDGSPVAPGPPDTEDAPPPSPSDGRAPPRQAAAASQARVDALVERLLRQANVPHVVTYSATAPPVLRHARDCREHLPSCPFTHAFALRPPQFRPGTSGTYECRLVVGRLTLGPRIVSSLDDYVSYTPDVLRPDARRRNGVHPVRR